MVNNGKSQYKNKIIEKNVKISIIKSLLRGYGNTEE